MNGCVPVALCFQVLCIVTIGASDDVLDESVSQIVSSLMDIANEGLGVTKFQEHLKKEGVFTDKDIDWGEVADLLADSLSARLTARRELVDDVAAKIQKFYDRFPTVDYNKECCEIEHIASDYNPRFRTQVDTTSMCVAKFLHATHTVKYLGEIIKEQWKYNLEITPSVKWQYFGTVDGVFYNFPASTVGGGTCGDFDPRLRPWYAAAMSFHKMMVFVVDTSTPMRLCITTRYRCIDLIVKMMNVLLDMLTSHDEIALVTFDKMYHLPEQIDGDSCFGKGFAIASRVNKQAILDYVKNLTFPADLSSKYSRGIDGALRYLESQKISGPILVFITGTSNTESSSATVLAAVEKVKKAAANVTLMTTYIGNPLPQTKSILQKMAKAAGRGSYTAIAQRDDIHLGLAAFYESLARTLPAKSTAVVSPPYWDLSDSGFGLVSTVCKAVMIEGSLYGVAAVDVPLVDLLADAVQFAKSKSYAIVIDTQGRTLSHPLLPKPSEASGDLVDITVETLEPGAEIEEKVFSKMKQQLEGNVQLYTQSITSKGITSREGITVEFKNMSYHFRKVPNTVFSLCVVAEVGDTVTEHNIKTPIPSADIAFTYHDVKLQGLGVSFCKQFFYKATKSSVVKFAPKAFLDPYYYLYFHEDREDVKLLEDIVHGKRPNTNLTDGVTVTVQLTKFLDKLWAGDHIAVTHGGSRYIGTELGVIRLYPGLKIAKNYDPTARPWYKRAINSRVTTTISPPYLDAFGAGFVVTVSQVVKEGSRDKVYGVIAIDFPGHYFYNRLVQDLPGCQEADIICFIMDSAGFIIVHPYWFDGRFKLKPPNYYEDIYIAEMEWDIAHDMMVKRAYLKRKSCVNSHDGACLHFAEMVCDAGSHMDTQPFYEYQRVPDTNIYLVRKNIKKSTVSDAERTCRCPQKDAGASCHVKEHEEHDGVKCQCPCWQTVHLVNMCTGEAHGSYNTCAVDASSSVETKVHPSVLKQLDPCFEHECSNEQTEKECNAFISCRWCMKGGSGEAIKPYCGVYDECYFGQVGHDSPYESNGNHICVSTFLLAAVGISMRYVCL